MEDNLSCEIENLLMLDHKMVLCQDLAQNKMRSSAS